jgi:Cu/Ag efflux pump CusA
VRVEVEQRGAGASEVEKSTIVPLERALLGLPGVQRSQSVSAAGGGEVVLGLEPSADPLALRAEVLSRLQRAELPPGVSPQLGPASSRVLLRYTLDGPAFTSADLLDAQDWVLRRALLQVPGVAEVTSCGGLRKRVDVELDPARCAALGLSFGEVARAFGSHAEATAGAAIVRGLGFRMLDELGDQRLGERAGAPVFLRDVAQVRASAWPPECVASRDGADDVIAAEVWLGLRANAEEVSRAVRERLLAEASRLPPGMRVRVVGAPGQALLRFSVNAPAGLSARALRDAVASLPAVEAVVARVGRTAGFGLPAPGAAELLVIPRERASEKLLDELFRSLSAIPGTGGEIDVVAEGVDDLERWSAVNLRVHGDDLAVLDRLAGSVRDVLFKVSEVRAVRVERTGATPHLSLRPDRAALARAGLDPRDLADGIGGRTVDALLEGERRSDVVLRFPVSLDDPPSVAKLMFPSPSAGGRAIALTEVAMIVAEQEPQVIRRDRGRRCVLLRITAPGLGRRALIEKARAAVAEQVQLPAGTSLEWEP